MNFELSSPFSPTGDQPEAIAALSDGIKSGVPFQTLLGVTGSWCAFPDLVGSDRVRKDFHYRQCDQGSAEADFDPES